MYPQCGLLKYMSLITGYPELSITTAGAMQASMNTKLCANAY